MATTVSNSTSANTFVCGLDANKFIQERSISITDAAAFFPNIGGCGTVAAREIHTYCVKIPPSFYFVGHREVFSPQTNYQCLTVFHRKRDFFALARFIHISNAIVEKNLCLCGQTHSPPSPQSRFAGLCFKAPAWRQISSHGF